MDLDAYKQFLQSQPWSRARRTTAWAEANLLVGYRSTLPLSERLREWFLEIARSSVSLPHAVTRVRALRDFLDFTGDSRELDQLLSPVRSATELLREIRIPGTSWEEAVERSRSRPRFQSALAGWLGGFLAYWAGRQMKPGSWPCYLGQLDQVALRNQVASPEQLTPSMLEEFLSQNQPSPRTRNNRLSKLRTLRRFLEPRGVAFHLPAGLGVSEPSFLPHLFTLDEIGRILGFLREQGRQSRPFRWLGLETVIFLLYACGLRMREPMGLRVQDVDPDRAVLLLYRTKFYKQRWVPLGEGAARRLRAYHQARTERFPGPGPEDRFFVNDNGRRLGPGLVRLEFRRALSELGIRSRGSRAPRLHDLRHTLAVHRLYQWYSEGSDVQNKLPLLSAYLGHDRIHHTEAYLHLTEDLVRQAGRSFQRSFEQVVGPRLPDEPS